MYLQQQGFSRWFLSGQCACFSADYRALCFEKKKERIVTENQTHSHACTLRYILHVTHDPKKEEDETYVYIRRRFCSSLDRSAAKVDKISCASFVASSPLRSMSCTRSAPVLRIIAAACFVRMAATVSMFIASRQRRASATFSMHRKRNEGNMKYWW